MELVSFRAFSKSPHAKKIAGDERCSFWEHRLPGEAQSSFAVMHGSTHYFRSGRAEAQQIFDEIWESYGDKA